MGKSKEQSDIDRLKIIEVYEQIVSETGKYAPYLSKEYFYENTELVCKSLGFKDSSRSTIIRALKEQDSLKKKKSFLLNDDN